MIYRVVDLEPSPTPDSPTSRDPQVGVVLVF